MAGKGDNRRPQQVDSKTMEDNWKRTFGSLDAKKKTNQVKAEDLYGDWPRLPNDQDREAAKLWDESCPKCVKLYWEQDCKCEET